MRTRTNINYGSGTLSGVEILKNYFPAGNITIIYDDLDSAEQLCKDLTAANYKVNLSFYTKSEIKTSSFVIGLGGSGVVSAVERCVSSKFAFFPSSMSANMLTPKRGKYAEFVFIDSEKINVADNTAVAEIHTALWGATTEALALFYGDKGMPFCDKGLLGAITKAKSILKGTVDREEYIKEGLRCIKCLVDCLSARGIDDLLFERVAEKCGGRLSDKIAAVHFLNSLLILFTKWNFHDMLIPSEKALEGINSKSMPRYGSSDLIFTKEEVTAVASKVKDFALKPELKKLVGALRTVIDGKNPLFAEIYNRGIPEGLINYG